MTKVELQWLSGEDKAAASASSSRCGSRRKPARVAETLACLVL